MKRIILVITACAIALATVSAQDKQGWKEKMRNEKIAFLTAELGITPEEGQVFWPVYNQVHKAKDEAMHKTFRAFKELATATKENRSNKEIEKLLNAYLDAQQDQREFEEKISGKFMKVLPVEKVARLYVAEEKFRREQIHKLNHGNHQKNQQK